MFDVPVWEDTGKEVNGNYGSAAATFLPHSQN